ncbi:hypothetical protein HMPREF1316_1825 [Olsenella profusa F0195]|uniref:Uncharacterized protein n=1 Tax=Olsenella profusa F0195 TaxID=1125712 RepID=U2TP40_9ACTN|nr:hypothetical protein HMPREF1316_1825 [Olsenella profusa F0195]
MWRLPYGQPWRGEHCWPRRGSRGRESLWLSVSCGRRSCR